MENRQRSIRMDLPKCTKSFSRQHLLLGRFMKQSSFLSVYGGHYGYRRSLLSLSTWYSCSARLSGKLWLVSSSELFRGSSIPRNKVASSCLGARSALKEFHCCAYVFCPLSSRSGVIRTRILWPPILKTFRIVMPSWLMLRLRSAPILYPSDSLFWIQTRWAHRHATKLTSS